MVRFHIIRPTMVVATVKPLPRWQARHGPSPARRQEAEARAIRTRRRPRARHQGAPCANGTPRAHGTASPAAPAIARPAPMVRPAPQIARPAPAARAPAIAHPAPSVRPSFSPRHPAAAAQRAPRMAAPPPRATPHIATPSRHRFHGTRRAARAASVATAGADSIIARREQAGRGPSSGASRAIAVSTWSSKSRRAA